MSQIIAGWPGIGKSYLGESSNSLLIDLNSGDFSKTSDFPKNYIDAMLKIKNQYDFIFISCHSSVIKSLEDQKIEYTLVYPEKNLKEEYLLRYKQRGNPSDWIDNVANNWDEWMSELDKNCKSVKIRLKKGQYLSDIL